MERRTHPRTCCRLQVSTHAGSGREGFSGTANNAGLGGAFVTGGARWQPGDTVQLRLVCRAGAINLEASVVRVGPAGSALRFARLPQATSERLAQLLWPTWDRRDLLEGLLLAARNEPCQQLSRWLDLTTVLAERRAH